MAEGNILNHRFTDVEYISHGGFGVVVSAKFCGNLRAVKLIDPGDPDLEYPVNQAADNVITDAINEIKILSDPEFEHQNLVKYHTTWVVDKDTLNNSWRKALNPKFPKWEHISNVLLAIEMELCAGGSN